MANESKAALNVHARAIIDFICATDPTWAERLQIVQSERGFDDLQTLVHLAIFPLERDEHMNIMEHALFSAAYALPEEGPTCPQCHKGYKPAYPGQPYCSNACAGIARGPHKTDAQKQREAMEARLAAMTPLQREMALASLRSRKSN